jgi:membrane protein DedA with SNARE-associated domain
MNDKRLAWILECALLCATSPNYLILLFAGYVYYVEHLPLVAAQLFAVAYLEALLTCARRMPLLWSHETMGGGHG